MLHFFRKIRRDLLGNSQFFRYLKYAVGEILLVVIGILIAIQVDNWNEDRISAEKMKLLFQEVNDELVLNIKSIDRILRMNIRKDSLYFKVLNEKVGPEDYIANPNLNGFPNNWNRTSLVDEDFQELVEKKQNLTPLQDSLFLELKELYGKRKRNADRDDELQVITQHNFRESMMREMPWFRDWNTGEMVTAEMIQYWLNDPSYLNRLSEMQFREYWLTLGILWFRSKAIDLHEKITKMLEIEKDTTLFKDMADFEHVKGVYKYKSFVYKISMQRNELKTKIIFEDSRVQEWDVYMYPFSNSHLIISEQFKGTNWLCEIVLGKDGEVSGLIHYGDMMKVDGKRRMAIKIE